MKKVTNSPVINNAIWIIVCKALQSLLTFVITVLSARYYGPSNYGLLAYAAAIVAFFLPIAQLGLSNTLVQELVSKPEEEGAILGSALWLSSISSFVCIGLSFAFVIIFNHGEKDTLIVSMIYSVSLLFQSMEMIQCWFQTKLLSKYTSIVSLIAYFIVSSFKLILLITGQNVYWFALAYSIDFLLITAALFFIYSHLNGQRLKVKWDLCKRLFSNSKYYILPNIMVTVFTQTDRLMLKQMLNNEAAGFYSAAVTCAGLTGFVINAIVDSARPVIFKSATISESSFEDNLQKLYSVALYFCFTQSLFTMIFAPVIIGVIYGEAYSTSISALRIITWYVPFACLGAIRNIWMLAKNQQKYLLGINLIGGISNVVLNAILIPKSGINGAAFASFLSQFITNVVLGFLISPIRRNNILMIKGLNPRSLISVVERIKK